MRRVAAPCPGPVVGRGAGNLRVLVSRGRCGGRMTVRYCTSDGHPQPLYSCQRRGIQRAEPACQILPGAAVDGAVGDLVLEPVTPRVDRCRGRGVGARWAPGAPRAIAGSGRRLPGCERTRSWRNGSFCACGLRIGPLADSLERHWNEALQRLAAAEEG